MRHTRTTGASAVEIVISAALAVGILAAGTAVTTSSTSLAATTASDDAASRRVARVMREITDEIRCASLASLRGADGTTAFADGATSSAAFFRRVLGYSGSMRTDTDVAYRFDVTEPDGSGEVIRSQDGAEETVARGVTSLSFTRTGELLTVSVGVRAGPSNDRGRRAVGTVSVRPRNP